MSCACVLVEDIIISQQSVKSVRPSSNYKNVRKQEQKLHSDEDINKDRNVSSAAYAYVLAQVKDDAYTLLDGM